MSSSTSYQFSPQSSNLCPTTAFRVGGDGASHIVTSGVLAHCRVAGAPDLYYYSSFSGGPGEKCPPDLHSGGSLDEVTVPPAPFFNNSGLTSQSTTPTLSSPTFTLASSLSTISSSGSSNTNNSSETASSYPDIISPRPVPHKSNTARLSFDPPLTPPTCSIAGSAESFAGEGVHNHTALHKITDVSNSVKTINGFVISVREPQFLETPPSTPEAGWIVENSPALKFLMELFPEHAVSALPHATSVSISQDNVTWDGVVLNVPGQPKTLYVGGKGAESVQLRESIVALLDLADEHLGCSAFVIALERKSPALAALLHSLMYVSGTVVTNPPFPVDPKYVLVGMEI